MNEFLIAIILALGIARLTLILVRDDIFSTIRHKVFLISPPEDDERAGLYYQKYVRDPKGHEKSLFMRYKYSTNSEARKPGWWGQVLSCPDCSGVYVALTVLAMYVILGAYVVHVMSVFAASMVTSMIARRY